MLLKSSHGSIGLSQVGISIGLPVNTLTLVGLNKDIIVNMKENCLKKAENFTSDVCLENLYTRLNYKYPNSLNDENGMII